MVKDFGHIVLNNTPSSAYEEDATTGGAHKSTTPGAATVMALDSGKDIKYST